MFQLTNEQRRCFGLTPVEADWEFRQLPRSRDDYYYDTCTYVKGNKVYKIIQVGDTIYCEWTLNETLSDDGLYLLPKTAKGKPVKFTSAALAKRAPVGMVLSYDRGYISVYNHTTEQVYWRSPYDLRYKTMADFLLWLEKWCAETGEAELADIEEFAARKRINVKYKEGDFFRFRINRGLWGYGRLLLDYKKVQKENKNAMKFLFGPKLAVCVYHIATENKNVSMEILKKLKKIPSQVISDNPLFYGEFEIIGNEPLLPEDEDYPVHYDEFFKEGGVFIQCGKFFKALQDKELLFSHFDMHIIRSEIHVTPHILLECIRQNSNMPYWENEHTEEWWHALDLRHPKLADKCKAVFAQFGLNEEDFIKKDIQK